MMTFFLFLSESWCNGGGEEFIRPVPEQGLQGFVDLELKGEPYPKHVGQDVKLDIKREEAGRRGWRGRRRRNVIIRRKGASIATTLFTFELGSFCSRGLDGFAGGA